jgi:hypothetical protein
MAIIITCPNCSREFVKRLRRITIYERVLGFFYIYPFCCQLCDHTFKLFQPGVRYARVDEDRREHLRISVDFPVRLRNANIQREGRAADLSLSGCMVRLDSALPLGDLVRLEFQIPGETIPITVNTAIVRNGDQDRVGLEFLRFQGDERSRLRRVVRGLMDSAAFSKTSSKP